MKVINFNKEVVGVAMKKGGKVVLYCGSIILPYLLNVDKTVVKCTMGVVDYEDAIGAIMDSSMWSNDKVKLMDIVKRDGDATYYKSVINIANSRMFSTDKVAAIDKISKK